MNTKAEVRKFWDSSPCGTYLITAPEGSREFYEQAEKLRYGGAYGYGFLLEDAEFGKHRGGKVLEIGCGIGTDLRQFAKNGAIVAGVDLTDKGIELAKRGFNVMGLDGNLLVADAEDLPFMNGTFDYVYSFGVLHHTPDTQKAVDEVYRILKDGGTFTIALYHTASWEILRQVIRKLKHPSRWFWSWSRTLSYQTEYNKDPKGPPNPLTKTFTKAQAREMFHAFSDVTMHTRYGGWYLIIKGTKNPNPQNKKKGVVSLALDLMGQDLCGGDG